MRKFGLTFIALLFALSAAAPAIHGQAAVTTADIERLETAIDEAENQIEQLRSRDTARARRLQTELDDLSDEVVYLKVKLRREQVSRDEYASLRDRIANLDSRVRGTTTSTLPPPSTTSTPRPNEVPVGTEIDVRLQSPLSSDTAQVEDRFEATTAVDVRSDQRLLIPAGSVMRGVVTAVESAGRFDRKASLSLSFDQVTVGGRSYPVRATVIQALESGGYREDAGKIGAGAGVGAIIGGILGGLQGALAGILIGGGGVIAATEGEDVELPVGTVLRIRLDTPLTLSSH